MAGEAAQAMLTIQAMQSVFSTFESTFKLGSFLCPTDTPIEKITSMGRYNFIIIGGGTAGLVVANRLSECPSVSVLLIEAGGCPSFISNFLGEFTYIPRSKYDYDMYAVDDHYALQNLQNGAAGLTTGKMFGGSSSLHHAIFARGDKPDFNRWAKIANDSSWSYEGLLPYFIKSENVLDKQIVRQYNYSHGTCGPTKLKRQHSCENDGIFDAFVELGYVKLNDINNNNSLGITSPLLQTDGKYRQSSLVSYLAPVKDCRNLHVLSGAMATKIIFNDKKVAKGVQFSYNGRSYVVHSIDEVIVSAGAIKTPQLLMLSGIGPRDHLRSMNISVVSDLPVGKNLHDHVAAPMMFDLNRSTSSAPGSDPSNFPTPLTCSYANLKDNNANFAEYQGINLIFLPNNPGLLPLCLNVFKYKESICQKWYNANVNRTAFISFATLLHPVSRGEILLNTTSMDDQPIVSVGYLSNETDLVQLAKFLNHTSKLVNTTYFKDVGAEFVDLGLCYEHDKYSFEYWKCYALAMSTTMWHYCSTAALGSVVDNNLLVKGVSGLRVVDASVIPEIPGGKITAAILAIAEKAADVIKKTYKYKCNKCDCSCKKTEKYNY